MIRLSLRTEDLFLENLHWDYGFLTFKRGISWNIAECLVHIVVSEGLISHRSHDMRLVQILARLLFKILLLLFVLVMVIELRNIQA